LVISPWGSNPDFTISTCKSDSLARHYIKAVTILNAFKVDIDVERAMAELHLRQLEPETVITLKKVEFATSSTGNYQQKTVGSNVLITEDNCILNELTNGGYMLSIDLQKVCHTGDEVFWIANKPDFIKTTITIDFKGDNSIILPDKNKSVVAHRYKGAETALIVE
jgi:hypothetical protein